MKTKYYYNGKLIRTSNNSGYRYAVIDEEGNVKGCRSDYKAADAIITARINRLEQGLQNTKNAYHAAVNGQKKYPARDGRYCAYYPVRETAEYYADMIESYKKDIEYYRVNWRIVEIEAVTE